MADPADPGDRADAADRPQDPLVERARPDPSQPAEATKTLAGALGDSDRPGFRRLYFTAELDYYAEFRTDDVLSVNDITHDQPPFLGEQATRVTLRRDATVDFTRTQGARALDEFDLDVRLAARAPLLAAQPFTKGLVCQRPTQGCADTWPLTQCGFGGGCGGGGTPPQTVGCETAEITICRGATCIDVCETRQTCEQDTCDTCATCQTCNTACGQETCQTCRTRCNQDTCRTCETICRTCNPRVFTCGGRCERP